LLKNVDTTTTVGPTLRASTISQHENKPTRLSEDAEDNSPQVISNEPTIRHCYGKDQEDNLRLSMGSLTRDQLDTITILYQHSTKESFIEKLY
jgi:hypothetical protein